MKNDEKTNIDLLHEKLETLLKKHEGLSQEINLLRTEISSLKPGTAQEAIPKEAPQIAQAVQGEAVEAVRTTPPPLPKPLVQDARAHFGPAAPEPEQPAKTKSDWEKFIGENLINKIGIAVTIIGVGIGVKYAIDHELISPLVRIILGYLVGFGLLGFAARLKQNYENFSAVLLSGAMAIIYFITYAAYSFYELMPQGVTFALMVLITVFTVAAAIRYDKEVIAHIGLVGAYAVPFLLSDDPANARVLFTYTAIINAGILVLAFLKNWKPLYITAFVLTWLMFYMWYYLSYQTGPHFSLALVFISIFFATFYLIFLAYKLVQKEQFEFVDVLMLLANSFIFYGLGYQTLNGHETGKDMPGLFTLGNAVVHFIASIAIYRQKQADTNLFYLTAGLVLVFITIAIPVQLDGNWVTLLWAGEAALLFWIGRTKQIPFYESLSYILMLLAFFSLQDDWMNYFEQNRLDSYASYTQPLLNMRFLSTALFIAAFGFIFFLNRSEKYAPVQALQARFRNVLAYVLPAILLYLLYNIFSLEISDYWERIYTHSGALNEWSEKSRYPLRFKTVWLNNYALLFLSVLTIVNIRVYRDKVLGLFNLGFLVLAIASFLFMGLLEISELRESYLESPLQSGAFHIGIRYVSFAFLAAALFACFRYVRQEFIGQDFKIAFEMLLHVCILWVASSELVSWMDMARSDQSYKLGLSIFWGAYSLLLIALGIGQRKKYLRIAAIALFGVTLLKLFFYDIAHLDTIPKTIIFISLGALLLIISFLYNKYKNVIGDNP